MARGAGERLFGRLCRLSIAIPSTDAGDYSGYKTVSTLTINQSPQQRGLRVKGSVERTDEKQPNKIELDIYNLNDDHRAQMQTKGVKAILEAGYVSTGLQKLGICDVRTVDHVREDGDWITKLKGGDGERAYNYAQVNESFAPGAGAGDVLKYLANESGLQIGNVPDVVLNLTTTFDQGYVVAGMWKDEMDRLLRGLGYTWSIQDQTLQVLLPNSSIGGQIPYVSPTSGLIGSPEMGTAEKKGKPALVKFTSLLYVTRPRALTHLKSERYDGNVRAKKVTYEIDTYDGPWYTHVEGINQPGG